ncbi:MAG TPA: hypothetical protein VH351_20825 [Bryobacteraceae bacterium]|jgi:hypothetical protein|nr:hypothetical protein [Bryobacteraceae bacterium]
MRGDVVVFSFTLLIGFCSLSAGQDVVSASSGVVQYFEGAVLLDEKPVEHKAAVFPSLKNGSVVRTEKGRAELLLTPGVYLRLDENSALRMKSNSLVDTRLEVVAGRAIIDNLNAAPGYRVALVFNDSTVRFEKPGIYRIDSELGELEPYTGEAEVTHRDFTLKTVSTLVDDSHIYYFSLGMTTGKFGEGATDEFYDWAHNRSEMIADQNQMASAQQDESNDPDPGAAIAGIPSPFSPPSYSGILSPSVGSFYGSVIQPPYLYAQPSFFGFFPPSYGILFLPERHHWPNGTKLPPTSGFRPRPTRWPAATQTTISSYGAGTATHLPVHPAYGSVPMPSGIFVPRTTAPGVGLRPIAPRPVAPRPVSPGPVAPHMTMPHVAAPHAAIGHR